MSPKARLFSTILFASLLLVAMCLLFYLGNQLLLKSTTHSEATSKIQIHITSAHLWFEEVISGDKGENIETVWRNIDQAEWYINALIYGDVNELGKFYPLPEHLRDNVVVAKSKLAEFKEVAEIRFARQETSYAGSVLDKQFDAFFHQFLSEISKLEAESEQLYGQSVQRYQTIGLVLILVSLVCAVCLVRFLYLKDKSYARLLRSLTSAKDAIEVKNRDLHQQAHFDALTGLPNRVLFLDRLEQAILHSERAQQAFAVIFIDLDHFKEVNDHYGHQAGDKLLKMVSRRIQGAIRATDTAARISGDEFVIILDGMVDSNRAMQASSKISEQLIRSISNAYLIDDATVMISASIGVSIYPVDSSAADELIRCADNAMYYAKSLGKNNFQFYSTELNKKSISHSGLEHELKSAILKDEFIVHFQPRWNFKSGKISGIESLVRWKNPKRGLILPNEFISIAETAGLIHKVDLLVVRKVLEQLKVWDKHDFVVGVLSINISPYSFKQKSFISDLCDLIDESGVDASLLEIEIKEEMLANDKYIHYVFNRLTKLGVRLSLDDFGTDASSIKSLKDYKFNTLKIDRSYIRDQEKSETIAVVLENIIKLATDLGIDVVAEGIETEEQKKKLEAIGCDIGQGYVLTKPMTARNLEGYLSPDNKNNVIPLRR